MINPHDKPQVFKDDCKKMMKFGTWFMIFCHLRQPVRLLFGPADLPKNAGATLLLGELCRCLGPRKNWGLTNHQKDSEKLGTWKIDMKIWGKYGKCTGNLFCLFVVPSFDGRTHGPPSFSDANLITCLMEGFNQQKPMKLLFNQLDKVKFTEEELTH